MFCLICVMGPKNGDQRCPVTVSRMRKLFSVYVSACALACVMSGGMESSIIVASYHPANHPPTYHLWFWVTVDCEVALVVNIDSGHVVTHPNGRGLPLEYHESVFSVWGNGGWQPLCDCRKTGLDEYTMYCNKDGVALDGWLGRFIRRST